MATNPSLLPTQGQGKDYLPIAGLQTAQQLESRLESLKQGRNAHDRQWKLNLAFYKGRQYSYFNKTTRQLTTLPVEDGDKPRYRVRLVSNQIVTGIHSLLSKYLKTKPRMYATPGTGSHKDLKAAQMADKLLQFWWTDFLMDDALEEAMLFGLIMGQGYWKVCWDEHASKQMSFLLGPDGQPITDEPTKEAFRAMLEQRGIPPQEQVAYMGDIRIEVISPFDLYVDPAQKKFSDSKWAIQVMYLTPEEIKVRYNKDLKPDSVASPPDVGLPMGAQDAGNEMTVRKVACGYFLPQPAMPKGRIVTWSGGEILEDKPWDYPTNDLPFVKFPGVRVPGSIYDMSVVEQAIPLQKELNRTLSQIVEFKNMTVKPQWIAPVGSLRDRRTDEPGAIYQYNPVGNPSRGPEPMPIEQLPTWVFNHLGEISQRINDLFGRTEVTEGAVPPNVEAGVAIDLLQEMATDRIAPAIRLMELALARAGHLMLVLAKEYYIEPRSIKIVGSAGSTQVKEFTNADIDGSVSVAVEAGSGLPRTRAGRQARIEFFIQNQIIQPDQAYKFLESGDLAGIADQFSQDEDQAYRENEKLDIGQPLNMLAMQAAQGQIQQALQQGMDPDTGQPFQSQDEFDAWAQQTMAQAAVQTGPVDNHSVHIDVHGRVLKGIEWDSIDPQAQQMYIDHINAHFAAMYQLRQMQLPADPIRTTLQLKSTLGPTAQSKILTRQGIDTTPEESSEPPLETWVTDSVDKADVDGESPGQDGGVNLAKVAQINAQAQQDALDRHHQTQQSSIKGQMDVLSAEQKARQSDELHGQKLRQAAANASAAEAKARHAARPPAPTGKR